MNEITCLLLMIFTGSILAIAILLGIVAWVLPGEIIPKIGKE